MGSGEGCVKEVAEQKPLFCLPALGNVDPEKGLLDVPCRPRSEAAAKRRPAERKGVLGQEQGSWWVLYGRQKGE